MSTTESLSTSYDPRQIEARWRRRWAKEATYRTPEPEPRSRGDGRGDHRTYYCLDFFPYPSGAGLSVGHGRNYVPSDVLARYHRMRGEAVLHPMGWDAFGLPAENEAIKQGIHPAESTRRYARNYHRQLDLLGCSYDWAREINSSDPAYYRWNQFFFLMLYRRGLAYRAAAPVNWCASCETVLAAEEIEQGRCWRCHQPVTRRTQMQWYVRTTAYADELYDELDTLDWPEHILSMQRHWIGRQEGVEIDLPITGSGRRTLRVFTTRPDTLFGVTFAVLAPEHPQVLAITTAENGAQVRAYRREAAQRSGLERRQRDPDGAFTGAYARLPDGSEVPIYVADYVLADYGTGAVMGVPAHDVRDFAFARRHGLPIAQVIAPRGGTTASLPFTDTGVLIHSGDFSDLGSEAAAQAITHWLIEEDHGQRAVHYRLRDWVISRQRYWGTPIPIVHCPVCGEVPVPEAALPVELPPLPDYQPRGDGRSPLANVPDFVETPCPHCRVPARRETDTMTGFVCSSWYYLRFADPHNAEQPFAPEKAARWLPVDVYIGGAEHAVGHLLYSRFWTKVLADEGLITFREPFPVLRSQGVLHARDAETGGIERMSKSKGNTVSPESVIDRYGADATRLHLLFMGPFEANTVWEVEDDVVTPQHIEGVRRFLRRVWSLCPQTAETRAEDQPTTGEAAEELERATHRTIKAVTEEIEALRFNTAISALMSLLGEIEAHRRMRGNTAVVRSSYLTLLRLLAPLAPYITEELWARTGKRPEAGSLHHAAWPTWDPALTREDEVEIAVQVDGKIRARITVDARAKEAELQKSALEAPGIQDIIEGAAIQRVIVVPGRLVNIVTG